MTAATDMMEWGRVLYPLVVRSWTLIITAPHSGRPPAQMHLMLAAYRALRGEGRQGGECKIEPPDICEEDRLVINTRPCFTFLSGRRMFCGLLHVMVT